MTLPGKKLVSVGSYRLTGRRLGKGNFARVEEAYHTILKAKVALKVMNLEEIKEEYVVRNLYREARLMSRLSHPCIAALYETMQNGSMYYLVTELLGGGDLCSYIRAQRGGKLEEKSTKCFGRQLVSAVAYMHNMGIVHRDLKMENIMLNDAKTQVKIVDFGLSNTWSADSPLHTHCGSPEYAAPELFITGQVYGPQVDLWSLGVILYGMVMGQLPFLTTRDTRISSQERRKHLLAQINRGLAPLHRKALSAFSIEFRAMLARLLMPEPAKRILLSELVRHPWITDKNRRPLRVSGLRDLEPCWKTIIIKEISKLTNLDVAHVEFVSRTEPNGILAGMFNILSSRRMLQADVIGKESLTQQRSSCNESETTHNAARYDCTRPGTPCPPRMSGTHRKSPERPQATAARGAWTADIQGTSSRLRVVGTRNIGKPYNLRNAVVKSAPVHRTPARTPAKPAEPIPNRCTKSDHFPQPRAATPSGPSPNTAADRVQKRKSEQLRQQRSSTKKSAASSRTSRTISQHPSPPAPPQTTQQPAVQRSTIQRPSTQHPPIQQPALQQQRTKRLASTKASEGPTPKPRTRRPASTPAAGERCRAPTNGGTPAGKSEGTKKQGGGNTSGQRTRYLSAGHPVAGNHSAGNKQVRNLSVGRHSGGHHAGSQSTGYQGGNHGCGTANQSSGDHCALHQQTNRQLFNEPIARCIAGYVDKYMNVNRAQVDQRFCIIQPSRASNKQRQVAQLVYMVPPSKQCKVPC